MKEKETEKRKRRKGESAGLMENTDHENGRRQCDRRNGTERKKENGGAGRTWLPLVTSLCFLRKLKLYLKQPLMLNSYSAPPTSSVPNTTAAA